MTDGVEKINNRKAQNRYWRFRNIRHLREYESKRYPKRKQYILKLNKKNSRNRKYGSVMRKGYKYIFMPNHPQSTQQGYVCEHRTIMECIIGRYLKTEEQVHHIDGNKQNNNISNLELCKDIIEHNSKHTKERDKLGRFVIETSKEVKSDSY